MNLLRSPVVTGALVIIALAVLIYQLMPGIRGKGASAVAKLTPTAGQAKTAQQPNTPTRSGGNRPGGIDRDYVGMHFHGWVAGASHDPFLLNRRVSPKKGAAIKAPPALAKWKLKAILLQTGSRMAAINDKIYREGDVVEGYKIVSIDEDTVWFQTPNSREHLEFQRRPATRPILPIVTNAPSEDAPSDGAPPADAPVAEKDEVSGTKP